MTDIIKDDYTKYYEIIGAPIGIGGFGSVSKGREKKTKELRAIKVIDLDILKTQISENYQSESQYQQELKEYVDIFKNEFEIMKELSGNNNSVKCYKCFMNEKYFVFIMELCDKNLKNWLFETYNKYGRGFNDIEIYKILIQLNKIFKTMGEKNIVHRDLKPENILVKFIDEKHEDFIIKLTDYGCSKRLESISYKNIITTKHIGTPLYMAPEILKGKNYNNQCDLWSLGLIIYKLYFNHIPFIGANELAIKNNLEIFDINKLGKTKNKNLDDLIRKLLQVEPDKRLKWENYFNHPFFIKNSFDNNKEDKSSPSTVISDKNIKQNIIKSSYSNTDNPYLVIKELDEFINETLRIVDPNNEMSEFKLSFETLKENILGRKIRIAFIGNIGVGKSNVLNCIIGKSVLPTEETVCTYRGVIVRYKDIDSFELYKTKLISKGKGLNQYYYSIDKDKPFCRGIKTIKSFLKNQNFDKVIKDEDAYFVITGRLRIFDFIKLDKNIINKIEFIDLPGLDRKDNSFYDNKYYDKIIKFSNVCIYINEPESINDNNRVMKMKERFSEDKNKVFPNLRSKFIKTCLFLINKSDTLIEDSDREKTVQNLIKNFPPEEMVSKDDINISFFSAQSFLEYLDIYDRFVESIYINTTYFLRSLYDEWAGKITFKNFASYIKNNICSRIEAKLDLDLEDMEIEPGFYDKMKKAMKIIYEKKFKTISDKEEEEIIQNLYNLYYSLKTKKFDGASIYSHEYFDILKKVILFSENIYNDNLKNALNQFFTNADELFNKEKEKEDEQQIKDNKEKYDFIKNEIIPKINQLFLDKEKAILNIFDLGIFHCNEIIDDEIKNIDERLQENDKDIEKVLRKLAEKIKVQIGEVNKEKEKQVNLIITEIKNLLKDKLNEYFSKTNVNINKGLTMKSVISLLTSTISGIAVRRDLLSIGEKVKAGENDGPLPSFSSIVVSSLFGPVLLIGVGVLSVTSYLVGWVMKSKWYQNCLEESKNSIAIIFNEIKSDFSSDFKVLKESVINELKSKFEILRQDINKIDKEKWEEIKKNYIIQKKNIEKIILNKLKD